MFYNLNFQIMRKQTFIAGAFAILALASCSSDEVVGNVQTAQLSQQTIGFSPLTNKATRAVVNEAADLGDFAVTAYVNTPGATGAADYYFGNSTPVNTTLTVGSVYAYSGSEMKNIKISYNAGGWDYANAADLKYWPYTQGANGFESTTSLDFVAISPASIATATGSTYTTSATGPGASFTGYTIGTDDVCFATATGKKQSDGAVPLQFKHLLSQVVFAAKQATGFTAEVKEIKLGNVPNKGGWTSATNTWTAASTSPTTADYAGVSAPITVTASGDGATAQVLTATGSEILLMPQNAADLTYDPAVIGTTDGNTNGKKWAIESGTDSHWNATEYEAINKLFLKVSVRIKDATGAYTLGSATEYEDIYYCIKTDWKPGFKYTYTLLFGGVKGPDGGTGSSDDIGGGTYNDGEKVFTPTPITFTATCDPWTDASQQIAF